MNLFADSSAWIALYDERDKYHVAAQSAFRQLGRQPAVFVMTDYVMAETMTMILYRAGHARAVRFGEWALRSINVRQVRVDMALWNEAWRLFKMYDDKDFSFVDCTSFAIMRREHLADAFTFDHHFGQMGFRLWPGLRPGGK
jgi:predicted nucleic acid-binding protein